MWSPPKPLTGGVQAGAGEGSAAGAGAGIAGFFAGALRFGAAFLAAFFGAFFADFLAADFTVLFFLRAGAAFFFPDFFFALDFFAMISPPDRCCK